MWLNIAVIVPVVMGLITSLAWVVLDETQGEDLASSVLADLARLPVTTGP
ncbi:MAG: hypothetical protein ACYCXA_10105 [Actinomycetes bacterium]